jgi:hypothetical protein
MRNKLLVSIAALAAGIAVASCEKTPSGEPAGHQGGSPTAENQQSQSAQSQQPGAEEPGGQRQPKAQQHSSQTASQAPPAGNVQQSKEAQHDQRAEVAKDRNKSSEDHQDHSNSSQGQASHEDRTGGPNQRSAENAPGPGEAQPNQPQQSQLNEQKSQPGPNQQATSGAAGGAVNLGRDQVRRAQMALKEKGFDVGELDGVLGPRTRKALIAFQRQQGLEPSGQFDQRTSTALGISNGPGPTTSGHSGGAQ